MENYCRNVNFCPIDGYPFVLDEPRCVSCGLERSHIIFKDESSEIKPWRKMLYQHQPYEDNYTDPKAFLKDLRTNQNVIEYDYLTVLMDSLVVSQQISIVALFLVLFINTLHGDLSALDHFSVNSIISVVGSLVWRYTNSKSYTFIQYLKGMLTLSGYILGIYFLSPLMQALTEPISDDTITALVLLSFIVHLAFQDFGYLNGNQSMTKASHHSAPTSLNAAIFASLMLASRLPSSNQAFTIVLSAITLFALFPLLAHSLKLYSQSLSAILTVFIFFINVWLLFPISRSITLIYITTITFITFLAPFCLQWVQRYKNEIHGPWDEAVPSKRFTVL